MKIYSITSLMVIVASKKFLRDPRPLLTSDGADANVRPRLTLADRHPIANPALET